MRGGGLGSVVPGRVAGEPAGVAVDMGAAAAACEGGHEGGHRGGFEFFSQKSEKGLHKMPKWVYNNVHALENRTHETERSGWTWEFEAQGG